MDKYGKDLRVPKPGQRTFPMRKGMLVRLAIKSRDCQGTKKTGQERFVRPTLFGTEKPGTTNTCGRAQEGGRSIQQIKPLEGTT